MQSPQASAISMHIGNRENVPNVRDNYRIEFRRSRHKSRRESSEVEFGRFWDNSLGITGPNRGHSLICSPVFSPTKPKWPPTPRSTWGRLLVPASPIVKEYGSDKGSNPYYNKHHHCPQSVFESHSDFSHRSRRNIENLSLVV